jgi:WD40 repeat protein
VDTLRLPHGFAHEFRDFSDRQRLVDARMQLSVTARVISATILFSLLAFFGVYSKTKEHDRSPRIQLEKVFKFEQSPNAVVWSSDGKLLVTADGFDRRIVVWDYDKKAVRHQIYKTFLGFSWLKLTPDGRHLITSATSPSGPKNRMSFSLIDVATGQVVRNIDGPESNPPHGTRNIARKFAIDRAGKYAASITSDINYDYLSFYNVADWSLISTRKLIDADGSKFIVSDIAFSPANRDLVLLGIGGGLRVWRPELGREIGTARVFTSFANAFSFSPDGNLVVALGGSRSSVNPDPEREAMRLWDAYSWRLISSVVATSSDDFRGHSLAFSPNGKYIASTNLDGKVRIWDAKSLTMIIEVRDGGSGGVAVSFAPDGKRLAIVRDFDVRVVTLQFDD